MVTGSFFVNKQANIGLIQAIISSNRLKQAIGSSF